MQEKLVQKLPRNFYKEVYDCMNEWLQHKPSINPPHARDTLNPSDANYEGRHVPVSTHGQFPINEGLHDSAGKDNDYNDDAGFGLQPPMHAPRA